MKIAEKIVGNWCLALVVTLAFLATGCQDNNVTGKISGKITFQGKPVTVGDVTFSNASTGGVAAGELSPEGEYLLLQSEQGLKPGEYKVTVSPKVTYEKANGRGYEAGDVRMVESGGKSIPEAFRNDATTRLRATVTGGQDTFDFELGKK